MSAKNAPDILFWSKLVNPLPTLSIPSSNWSNVNHRTGCVKVFLQHNLCTKYFHSLKKYLRKDEIHFMGQGCNFTSHVLKCLLNSHAQQDVGSSLWTINISCHCCILWTGQHDCFQCSRKRQICSCPTHNHKHTLTHTAIKWLRNQRWGKKIKVPPIYSPSFSPLSPLADLWNNNLKCLWMCAPPCPMNSLYTHTISFFPHSTFFLIYFYI